MADIRAGDEVSLGAWPESVTVTENTDLLNLSNTVFAAGSPECSVTFMAPASGRVGVCVAAEMREQDATNRLQVAFELYEGSTSGGTLKQAARVQFGVSTSGDGTAGEFQIHGNMVMIDGLTAGVTHFVRTMHMVAGGTLNDIGHRRLVVIPLT